MPIINSFTNWGALEEVWLGDVYPASWYDHLSSEVRDCFYELTERTQQDLNFIEKKLQELGVVVRRPIYDSIDNYIDPVSQQLRKPEICPRDLYVTIGQTLYAQRQMKITNPWQQHIDLYVSQGAQVDTILRKNNLFLNGATTVRAGRDLYFDLVHIIENKNTNNNLESLTNIFREYFAEKFKNYRTHILHNGGHVDACFSLLKPGLILGNQYFDDYERTFPHWNLISLYEPQYQNHRGWSSRKSPSFNGKWWLPGVSDNKAFNSHVIKHAQDWVGDYTETIFEVNCLVIDEHNVMVPGENEAVFKALENYGITAHPVPFRTRTFWDGGLHCITLDIRRRDSFVDYFPEREEFQIRIYN